MNGQQNSFATLLMAALPNKSQMEGRLSHRWAARITEDGYVCWTEACYCPTPLKHERETQLDQYFSEIDTTHADGHKVFDGFPLIAHLASKAD